MDFALSPSHQSPTDSAEEAKFLFSGIVASFDDFEVTLTTVPEPSTALLLSLGLGLCWLTGGGQFYSSGSSPSQSLSPRTTRTI